MERNRALGGLIAGIALAAVLAFILRGKVGVEKRDEHGMTALMRAARAGDTAEARRLIAEGADVNARVPTRDLREFIAFISWMRQLPESDIGFTPLLYAAQGGHEAMVRLLIGKGARVDETARGGYRPLLVALYASNLGMMRLLVESGARLEDRYLAIAVAHSGTPEAVRFLLGLGADPNGAYSTTPESRRAGPKPVPVIILAAQRGDPGILKALLERDADPGATDENGWTALRWAVKEKRSEAVRLLEGAGVKDDFSGDDALIRAARDGNPAAAEEELKKGANANARDDRGVSPLIFAARNGNPAIVDLLLAAGARPDYSAQYDATALINAARAGHTEVIARLIKAGADVRQSDRIDKTPLYQAVSHKRLEAARALLDGGADANDGSLASAALGGDMDLVKLLLDRGAKADRNGTHLLNEAARGAARGKNEEILLLLLERGADPKGVEGSMGPLHYAAANCGPAVLRAMLARGAGPNARDLSANTPLMFAAGSGKADNVRVLIAAGADVNAKDDDAKTVLDHAARHPEVQKELRGAGAK